MVGLNFADQTFIWCYLEAEAPSEGHSDGADGAKGGCQSESMQTHVFVFIYLVSEM